MRITRAVIVTVVVMLLGCDTGNRVDPIFQDYFIKYYGEDGNQEGVDLYVNDDGTMALLGNSYSLTEPKQPVIVKTDSLGNVLWQRTLGAQNETAVDVELITQGPHQGKWVVVSNVGQRPDARIRLTIVDQSGKGIDSLIVDSPVWQIAESVTIASNDDFLISGSIAPDATKNPNFTNHEDDNEDIVVLRVTQSLETTNVPWVQQGGQYNGWGVKTFEVTLSGTLKYAVFGWSDYSLPGSAIFEDKFDVIAFDEDGGRTGLEPRSKLVGEKQTASQAIKVPASQEDGFFMIGSSQSGSNTDIYISKYSKDLSTQKLDQKIPLGGKMEGIAVASAIQDEGYFLLGNEIQDNSNRNIFLLHMRLDGSQVWSSTFGTAEGNDTAGAVAALKNGRVAVLGTIDLETQQKMALIIVDRNGGFSN